LRSKKIVGSQERQKKKRRKKRAQTLKDESRFDEEHHRSRHTSMKLGKGIGKGQPRGERGNQGKTRGVIGTMGNRWQGKVTAQNGKTLNTSITWTNNPVMNQQRVERDESPTGC